MHAVALSDATDDGAPSTDDVAASQSGSLAASIVCVTFGCFGTFEKKLYMFVSHNLRFSLAELLSASSFMVNRLSLYLMIPLRRQHVHIENVDYTSHSNN